MIKSIKLFLLTILLYSCGTDPDPEPMDKPDVLPPITMTGENTFGFLLDGEVWIPKDDETTNPFKNVFHTISYDELSGTLQLQVENIDTITNADHLIKVNVFFTEVGIYKMPPPPYNGGVLFDFNLGACYNFISTWDTESKIEITKLDQTNRIVAGLFDYTSHNDCGDTIRITEGRFDMRY